MKFYLLFLKAKEHHNSVARFLESRGMIEDALEVATDPDYRFELSIQLGRLEIARLELAEQCMKHAMDLSGLLLLYSSLGDAEGIATLASLSKEQGKNNVAFLCLFMLGKLEDCLQLLLESNRIPEAALMARSYLPSKVSEMVAIWRKDLNRLELAEQCMKHAMDLSGLLLLYSSLGDAEGIATLPSLSKEQGKNNVAFLCLFVLGKLEDCLQLLLESNRIPEAALMARSYLPSKVSEMVAIWRKDLNRRCLSSCSGLFESC
ncbi:coatomer subunit beta'-1-like isoform X2 [Hibiscus syriacus]|uniref:coatomer subunit beta'-1-like isoform X2 n=1 Tax=Hibiscus syriacus TaxID=106335 RepID=UPI0019208C45|nr:coatomer subunit beta'-1-like isoform X2 [Hibiscus syriacus]